MNKTLIAIAAAIIAATTMFTSAAEAGMKLRIGFGFPIGGFHAHGGSSYGKHHRRHKYVKRRVKKKVYHAKKKSSSSTQVAKKVEAPKVEPVVKVETENSSITTAALPAEETPVEETPVEENAEAKTTEPAQETAAVEPKPAAAQKASSKLDCKKFFPSVGMTLSVSCE